MDRTRTALVRWRARTRHSLCIKIFMNLYEVRILSADAAAPTPQRRARRQRRNEQTAAGAAAAVTDAHHRSGIGNRYLFLCADL